MVNESIPSNSLPVDFVPDGSVATHRVADGEDWASVAKEYGVDENDLIAFNFHTNNTDEVNWYLRRNTGCSVSNDANNWAFSSSATPGLIYIPPAAVINMDPEIVTAEKPVMQRIQEIANVSPGNEGIRMRGLLAIESLADAYQPAGASVGGTKDRLWFYNAGAVSSYLNRLTTDDQRHAMTTPTNGQFPFDGDLGPGFEQVIHVWRIYLFGEIVAQDAANPVSDSYLKTWLEGTENAIYQSWQEMANVDGRFSLGGGSVVSPLVVSFLSHVHDLAQTPTHLYSVYQENAQ